VVSERCQCRRSAKRRLPALELSILLSLEAILTALAIVALLRTQPELAAVSGVGCVTLAERIAVRLGSTR
jgi:threonine/homoserine efflux transporter RhtA